MFEAIWRYRFIYRDINDLVARYSCDRGAVPPHPRPQDQRRRTDSGRPRQKRPDARHSGGPHGNRTLTHQDSCDLGLIGIQLGPHPRATHVYSKICDRNDRGPDWTPEGDEQADAAIGDDRSARWRSPGAETSRRAAWRAQPSPSIPNMRRPTR